VRKNGRMMVLTLTVFMLTLTQVILVVDAVRKGERIMATLRQRKNGIWEIQYRNEEGRKTITLSSRKFNERTARQFRDAVEVLLFHRSNNDPRIDPLVKLWVERAVPEIREKLALHGLYDLPSKYTVQELWDTFIDKKFDVAESTIQSYIHARDRFFLFFHQDELIRDLTQDRMKEWKAFMLGCGRYGEPTVAGTISKAKAVFNWAKSQKWLKESPLDGVGRGSYRNEDNDYFVTREEYHRLLGACPCQEWRVIITLARYGGLHPCEIMTLRWSDIDEAGNRFSAFNAKLKRFKRLYERKVPLFPEVVVELDKLRSMRGVEDQEYVIGHVSNRDTSTWWQEYTRIAKRAGLERIPRPFDNMRASRATEVHDRYGAKKESLWIGHSEKIAEKFYLMVTDDDYAKAAGKYPAEQRN